MGVCSGQGQKRAGLELGPQYLRDQKLNFRLQELGWSVIDEGDIKPDLQNDSEGQSLILKVENAVEAILQQKKVLLTLGGDHSLALGSVQGTLNVYPDARVIWVDAHGDMNTPSTSLSGNLHGMPVAGLLGLFDTGQKKSTQLRPDQILMVGLRDVDPAEQKFIQHFGIQVISADEARQSPAKSLNRISEFIQSAPFSALHLSFDIDSLDPTIAAATGIRVDGGLSLEFAVRLALQIASTKRLVAVDFVELNPLSARNDSELQLSLESAVTIILSALT